MNKANVTRRMTHRRTPGDSRDKASTRAIAGGVPTVRLPWVGSIVAVMCVNTFM